MLPLVRPPAGIALPRVLVAGLTGLVNLTIIAWIIAPGPMRSAIRFAVEGVGLSWTAHTVNLLALAAYAWTSASMVAAWAIYRLERYAVLRPVVPVLVLVVGFGPLLCAVTFAAYVAEARGTTATWDKTEKTGKVAGA